MSKRTVGRVTPRFSTGLQWAAIIAAAALMGDCGKKDEKAVAAPGIAETKSLAEEGFIDGLPIVMNHAMMYEYAVDTKSSQFKAATGSEAGDCLVVGPDWNGETPAGIKKVFSSTTAFSIVVYRTQPFNPADMPNVEKVQAGYKAEPLSALLKQPAPPAALKIDFVPATTEGIKKNFGLVRRGLL